MKIWKALIVGVALCAASVAAAPLQPAYAQSATSLSGVWRGVYWGEGNQTTEFQATLHQAPNGALTGSIVENNTFSAEHIPFLLATLSGTQQGDAVSFVKTYDGTGGASHSISYSGRISSGGRRITGAWSAAGVNGQFELAR